jgi:hypothetical protein
MEVQPKKFINKAKQRKARKLVHSPDRGVGTSGNRCHECPNVRGTYGEKVSWGFGSNLP